MSTIILGLYLLFGTVTFIRSTRKMDIKTINTGRYIKWFLITMVFWPIMAIIDTLVKIGVVKVVTKKKEY
jgi:hypothetical protein